MKFLPAFLGVVPFHPDCFVTSREHHTREEAAQLIGDYIEGEVKPEELEENLVQFCFPIPEPFDEFEAGKPGWFTHAKDKPGAKKVWIYDPCNNL